MKPPPCTPSPPQTPPSPFSICLSLPSTQVQMTSDSIWRFSHQNMKKYLPAPPAGVCEGVTFFFYNKRSSTPTSTIPGDNWTSFTSQLGKRSSSPFTQNLPPTHTHPPPSSQHTQDGVGVCKHWHQLLTHTNTCASETLTRVMWMESMKGGVLWGGGTGTGGLKMRGMTQ